MSEKKVLVPVADGSEDIELACITDVLVRAGATVTVASVMPHIQVKLARNLNIVADCSISECTDKEWDVIACPGGMPGATHMSECAPLISMLKKQKAGGKLIAAVCASPAVIFAKHGLLDRDAQHTCYPAPKFREAVPGWVPDQVTSDASVITSQGPGTSLQFALRIVEKLYGREKATELAEALLTELC